MSYIGRGVDAISNVEKLDNITFDGSTTYNLTKSSVAFTPSGANNILISIDGVVQQGNFTVAGSTIIFDWSPTSSNTCNWIQHYGVGVLNVPADGVVSTAKVADDAITTDKLANSINTAITANTAKTTNATHSGEVTGATALTIADNIVDEANLKISNSAVNGYMLTAQSGNTGGLTWATAPSASVFGAVGFSARIGDSATTSLSDMTTTDVVFNTEMYDTNSAYNVSNGIFTVPVAGRYLFGCTLQFGDGQGNMSDMHGYFSIDNGSADMFRAESTSNATTFTENTLSWTGILDSLNVNQTVKIKVSIDTNDSSSAQLTHGNYKNIFWGVNIA